MLYYNSYRDCTSWRLGLCGKLSVAVYTTNEHILDELSKRNITLINIHESVNAEPNGHIIRFMSYFDWVMWCMKTCDAIAIDYMDNDYSQAMLGMCCKFPEKSVVVHGDTDYNLISAICRHHGISMCSTFDEFVYEVARKLFDKQVIRF